LKSLAIVAAIIVSLSMPVMSAQAQIIVSGDARTMSDPVYMPQAILLQFTSNCIDAAQSGSSDYDPVVCCQALELSHDLIVKTLMPLNERLIDDGLQLYDKMIPYTNMGPNSVGNIGYDGCVTMAQAGEI
jgi:hypothetical protein